MSNTIPSEQELRIAYRFLKGSQVPSVPDVVLKLNQALNAHQPEMEPIIKLVAQDQAITGKVLKTVNSAQFHLSQSVESIAQAVVMLGLDRLRNLVLAAAVEDRLQIQSPVALKIWKESLDVAKAAMHIAWHVDDITPDEAYLVGLLHDSGALLLAERYAAYEQLIQTQSGFPISFPGREQQSFGTNHTVIGYLFAHHWKLPEHYCQAIYLHHSASCKNLEDPKLRALIAILKIADQIAHPQIFGVNDQTFESIQYLTQAKKELMLADDDLSQLRRDAAVGFE